MDAIAVSYALALLGPLKGNKDGISENSGHKTILDLVDLLKAKQAEVDQLQSQINEMAEVGVSQESAIREKDKRIEELEMWIKGQIETLKCASKSWVYTEREQNIMLSQADDLEKALRGEHE